MKAKNLMIIASLAAAIGVAGCSSSSSSSSSTPSGQVQQLGIVSVIQFPDNFNTGIATNITAAFFQGDQNFSAAQATSGVLPSSDTCTVTEDDDDFSISPEIEGVDVAFTSLTAGNAITISSPAGTYTTLTPMSFFGTTAYSADDQSGAPPSGLTVDIPGDQFPAFANIAIPDVAALTGVSPEIGSAVTGSTTYTWTPSNDPDSRINIDVDNVNCVVIDDGSFTIPANIVAQADSDFGTFGYNIDRIAIRLVQSGNALLGVSHSSEL